MEERIDPIHEDIQEREERISRIRDLLEKAQYEELRRFLEESEPEDIAEILSEFSTEEKFKIFDMPRWPVCVISNKFAPG